jgi:hypothetical protein
MLATMPFINGVARASQAVPVAEFNEAVRTEAIMVFDSPPHIQPTNLLLGFVFVPLSVKLGSLYMRGALPHFSFRWDYIISRRSFDPVNDKCLASRIGVEISIDEPTHILGWEISSILNRNVTGQSSVLGQIWRNSKWCDAQIGALEDSRILGLPMANIRENAGRPPKSKCEKSYDECSESGNALVVLVDPVENGLRRPNDKDVQRGATFFIVLIIGGLVALYIYKAR